MQVLEGWPYSGCHGRPCRSCRCVRVGVMVVVVGGALTGQDRPQPVLWQFTRAPDSGEPQPVHFRNS